MIDPKVIGQIVQAAYKIYQQVEKTKKLRPLADSLEYRVKVIERVLDSLQVIPDTSKLDDSIARVTTVLQGQCLDYVTKLATMGSIEKFFRAGGLTEEHADLAEKLDSVIGDMSVALDAYNAVAEEMAKEQRETLLLASGELKTAQNELVKQQAAHNRRVQEELMELQALAVVIVQQGETMLSELGETKLTLVDIKEKLAELHAAALSGSAGGLPGTIKVRVLAEDASADEVVHEVVLGVAMGAISVPEDPSRGTLDAAKELAAFSLAETTAAHEAQTAINVEITVLEKGAYARLVTERTIKAQPGKIELVPRAAPAGTAALAAKEVEKRTETGGSGATDTATTTASSDHSGGDPAFVPK